MKIQRFLATAASLVTLAASAKAQQAPAVERITLQQAIEIALRQNLTIRQAENALDIAEVNIRQARSSYIPNFNVNFSGSNSFGRVFDVQTGTLQNKMTQSASSGIGSSVTLLDFGRGADIAAARANAAATEADLGRARQTAVYNVAQFFVQYVGAQSQLEVQKENLASQQLSEAQIQRFADAGARPISDLYNIKSLVAQAQLQVTQAEANIENAKFQLMQALQLDPAKDYDFVAPPIPDSLRTTQLNLDSLVNLAYQRRGDIRAAQSNVSAAQASKRSASRGHLPTIGVSAGYNSSGRFGQDMSFVDQFDQNRGGSIGTSFSFPIFDRGATTMAKTRAAIQEENAQLQLANTRQAVALDVRRAWFNVRSAQQQLIAAQAGVTAATQALEATQQRYNVGAATLLEVTQARAQRVNAASALATARYNLVLNQAAMAYFTGELDPANLTIGR
jgi:outer membrane protein